MSTPAPSLDPEQRKHEWLPEQAPPQKEPFWKPGKFITGGLAVIGALGGLIANVQNIADFLQPSLSGDWVLTEKITKSSYRAYVGHTATFSLFLVHHGHTLTGSGEKLQVDGKDIPTGQHQPIRVTGEVSGEEAILRYDQKPGPDGAARETSGGFTLKTVRSGFLRRQVDRLEGTFSGDAAATSGTAVSVRKPN
jgi:hypothetical protein